MDVETIKQFADAASALLFAVLIIAGFLTGRIVPGYLYRASEERAAKAEDRADKWMTRAFRGTSLAEEAVELLRSASSGGKE